MIFRTLTVVGVLFDYNQLLLLSRWLVVNSLDTAMRSIQHVSNVPMRRNGNNVSNK